MFEHLKRGDRIGTDTLDTVRIDSFGPVEYDARHATITLTCGWKQFNRDGEVCERTATRSSCGWGLCTPHARRYAQTFPNLVKPLNKSTRARFAKARD